MAADRGEVLQGTLDLIANPRDHGVFLSRLKGLFRGARLEESLDAELQSHLQFLIDENVRRAMSVEEARHAARREFGGLAQTKEAYREQRGLAFIDRLIQDLR